MKPRKRDSISRVELRWLIERSEQAVLRDADSWFVSIESDVKSRRTTEDTLIGSIMRLRSLKKRYETKKRKKSK